MLLFSAVLCVEDFPLHFRGEDLADEGLDACATVVHDGVAVAEDDRVKLVAVLLGQLPDAALSILHVGGEERAGKSQLAGPVVQAIARNQNATLAVKQGNVPRGVAWSVDDGESFSQFLAIHKQFVG